MKPENADPEPRPGTSDPPAAPRPKPVGGGEPGEARRARSPWKKRILLSIVAVVVLGGILFGVKEVVFYAHHAETDDAQVEGHIDPVLPKISGYVTRVLVDDNQRVAAGQLLLSIDTRDQQSKADTARAALANEQAAVRVAQANVAAARTASEHASRDLARYAALRAKEEISQQQYDAARAAADSAAAQLAAARQSVEAARAQAAQKLADLQFAELQLTYATVAAPVAGTVARKSVEVGQFVQAGQPLLAIVEDGQPWVIANFKETQLKKMRVGQGTDVEVDAYPKRVFHGRVDSISPATGAKFALLPPDNATGNFTKVVQRVPVKIVFTDPPDPAHPLRAGMSVNAIVRTD